MILFVADGAAGTTEVKSLRMCSSLQSLTCANTAQLGHAQRPSEVLSTGWQRWWCIMGRDSAPDTTLLIVWTKKPVSAHVHYLVTIIVPVRGAFTLSERERYLPPFNGIEHIEFPSRTTWKRYRFPLSFCSVYMCLNDGGDAAIFTSRLFGNKVVAWWIGQNIFIVNLLSS